MAIREEEEPIAIIGTACRFSGGVSDMGSLWDMISNSRTGHCKVPSDRWDADLLHHPDPDRKGTMAVQHGYFLQQDVSHFDAPFFQTTAKEAASMDPMKRLLLEVGYESIENAGIPVETLVNSQTGCYVGCMTNDYEMLSSHDMQDLGYTAGTSNSEAMTSNRLSWFFGLRGPSLTLDTACSSSLYTLHLACQSLKLREADMFLVAGVNLMLYPNTMEQFSAIHMLSPEGISHTFDDRANGYGRGEGIGCMVVKRLSDALRDGDTIRAIVRQTGTNADGKTPSITAPSTDAQADLIRRTYAAARLDLASTQYFESHGTGTPVGDPLECKAIAATIGAARAESNLGPLYIGSVKPNVGHTEGCAGMAGLLKAVLCLEKGMLVPTYDVQNINPKLTLNEWNLALPKNTMKFPSSGLRRISVNSFGFGGANAHVILDDAYHYMKDRGIVGNHNTTIFEDDDGSDSGLSMGPGTPISRHADTKDAKQLFVFSSKDQAGNQRLSKAYSSNFENSELEKEDPELLYNLSFTLADRRSHHDFRTFAVASSLAELSTELSKPVPKLPRASKLNQNLIFVCTGQGAQWAAMGSELLTHPIFKDSVRISQRHLTAQGCEWDIVDELKKTKDSRVSLPEFSQTLCTVLQVALVDLLRHWKVMPTATVGHSSGEIAAAYAASFISHADAIKIAYVRGISSASVPVEGAMMAAGVSRSDAEEYLTKVAPGAAVVACVNSPSSVTLSGDVDAIDQLAETISSDGKFARKLKVKTAYHSPHMRSVAESYFARMGHIETLAGGDTVMYSSLTGKIVTPTQLDAQYWVDNMCAPVEFSNAVTALLSHSQGKTATRWGGVVELGPHTALQGPVQQIIAATGNKSAKDAPYIGMVLRNKDAQQTALAAAGSLWGVGYDLDLSAVNGLGRKSSILPPKVLAELPTYPWNHSRGFWHEAYATRWGRFPLAARTDLLGVPEDLQNPLEPRWKNYLRISENPWIEDHKITGTILYPGAGMLVMALEAALQMADSTKTVQAFRFRDVSFERGLVVPDGDDSAPETRLSLLPRQNQPGVFGFTLFSTNNGSSWTKHCSGTVGLEYAAAQSDVEESATDVAWSQQSEQYDILQADTTAKSVETDIFYDDLLSIGMEYGPLFQNVTSLTSVPGQKACYGEIIVPDTESVMPANFEYPHVIHPATLDAIFHLVLAAVDEGTPTKESAVPYSLEDMWIAHNQPKGADSIYKGYSNLVQKNKGGREIVLDMIVSDEDWSAPKIIAKGFALRQVTSGAEAATTEVSGLRKCAAITWSEDIDFIRSSDNIARLQRSTDGSYSNFIALLDRLTHKKPVQGVLVAVDENSDNHKKLAQALEGRVGRRPGFESLIVWKPSEKDSDVPSKNAFDLVVVLENAIEATADVLAKLYGMVSESGRLIVTSTEEPTAELHNTLKTLEFASITSVPGDVHLSIATKKSSTAREAILPSDVYFLIPSTSSDNVTTLWSNLAGLLVAHGTSVHISSDQNLSATGKHVISFLEVESPHIYSWNDRDFAAFKSLVSTQAHVLWLTRGSVLESWAGGVEFAPAQGLLRVMRNEYPLVSLPHLDLSASLDITGHQSTALVFDVWRASLVEGAEMEYAEHSGSIHIPRAVSDVGFDGDLQLANGVAQPVKRAIRGNTNQLKASSEHQQGEFLWVEDEVALQPLGPQQVEIEVEFVGINAVNLGHETELRPEVAREAVGVVSNCGDRVKSVVVGQRVVVYGAVALKTRIRQHEALVAPIPWNLQPAEAAVVSSVFIAAQYALLEVAGLSHGQSILVHDAAGALGQAAIQVAQHVGATVFALVSSKSEKTNLIARYGLSQTRIFDGSRNSFIPAIHRTTKGRGVDAVLCYRPGPSVIASLDSLGDSGYFLDLGASAGDAPQIILPSSKRNASLNRIDLTHVRKAKAPLVGKLFRQAFSGPIMPIAPFNSFSISETFKAIDTVSKSTQSAVLSVKDDALVWTIPPPAKRLELDPEATYVLAGGLGALGLDIANMMADYGAKHLVFLSRSGGRKNEADLQRFESNGVLAEAFKCDVNDAVSVTEVFDKLRSDGRIVRGLIQCAMVLEDSIFDNMTYDNWWRAFQPKTRGSRNLLSHLQLYADANPFFILLSSITGVIGNSAQANYASGNTFEDALAHHARTHSGISATSIDVGLVNDASHFETGGIFGDLKSYLSKYQHGWAGLQCTLEELRVAIRAIMRGCTADGQDIPAQVVLGLEDTIVRPEGGFGYQRDQKFNLRITANAGDADGSSAERGFNIAEKLRGAASMADAAAFVEEAFKIQVAAAFGIEVDEVDSTRPLPELGVDSLKAVEIRNRVLKEMQSDISIFEILSATPMVDVAANIAAKSALVTVK